MTPRRRDLAAWGQELYTTYGPTIAELLGVDRPPTIRIHVAREGAGAAWTSGTDVYLSSRWFAAHPDDAGGCLHEFAHAIMRAPTYDASTAWLIEGIADYVRDVLGHSASWTLPHYGPGEATAGYQTTAHFLMWLESTAPGAVRALARRLVDGTYTEDTFVEVTGRSLDACVVEYEVAQRG
jgi:hypothetical protein